MYKGDIQKAIDLYLNAGLPAKAAKIMLRNPVSRFNSIHQLESLNPDTMYLPYDNNVVLICARFFRAAYFI